jgi:hypothetical protein
MPFKTAEIESKYQRHYRQIHKAEKAENDKQYYQYRKAGGVKLGHHPKASNNELLESYNRLGSVWMVAAELGMAGQTVWERLKKLGISDRDKWNDEQIVILRQAYSVNNNEPLNINELSVKLGKIKSNVCRKARELGLTTNRNRRRSEDVKRHQSETRRGENSSNWQGGISYEPYTAEFNKAMKAFIRKRDGYTCQLCSILESNLSRKLSCHHIDYNKKNCDPLNLISLCISCPMKTEYRRHYYTKLFQELINKRLKLEEDTNEGI